MEAELRNGYTVILKNNGEKVYGTALKKEKFGLITKSISDEELKFLEVLPNMKSRLEDGYSFRLYMDLEFHIEMGMKKTEGPYCEGEYFEVSEETKSPYLLSSLVDMESKCYNFIKGCKVLRKDYSIDY